MWTIYIRNRETCDKKTAYNLWVCPNLVSRSFGEKSNNVFKLYLYSVEITDAHP